MLAVRESHPVECSHVVGLRLFHEIAGKGKHIAVIVGVSVFSRGSPLAKDDGCAFQVRLQCADCLFHLALGRGEALHVDIAVHLEDEVVLHIVCGQLQLLQRVLQVRAPRAAAATCAVGADDEVALCVVAARCADSIDKALGIAVDGIVG